MKNLFSFNRLLQAMVILVTAIILFYLGTIIYSFCTTKTTFTDPDEPNAFVCDYCNDKFTEDRIDIDFDSVTEKELEEAGMFDTGVVDTQKVKPKKTYQYSIEKPQKTYA